MINNNNKSQNTTVSPIIKSESSIYLKKSELPKNISSFKNDMGYISTSALDSWLKDHSYISKNEINALIKKANLTVIDTVNKSYDDEAIGRLNNDIISVKGEIVAIKDRLNDVEAGYVTTEQAGAFAKRSDVRNLENRMNEIADSISDISIDIDTSNLATKDSIPTKVSELVNDSGFITRHQSLKDYVKNSDLPDFSQFVKFEDIDSQLPDNVATKEWVENKGYLTQHQSLSKYAKKTDIPDVSGFVKKSELPSQSLDGLASKEWVREQGYLTQHQSLSKYAKKTDIPDVSRFITLDDIDIPSIDGLASKEWVRDQGYLTQHQSLSKYAKKTDIPDTSDFIKKNEIPSVDGLASKDWVREQGYLTQHQSLSKYAKKTDLPVLDDYATQEWVLSQGFLTEGIDLGGYVKKSDLNGTLSGYVKKSELSGYVKKGSVYDKDTIDSTFLTQEDAKNVYLRKDDAAETYMKRSVVYRDFLQIEDYRGLKDASVISDTYKDKTFDEFVSVINDTGVRNGFYIVENQNVIVVKDNSIISMFHDGVPESILKWKEEFD